MQVAGKSRKKEDVDSYRHEDETRKNPVPVSLASYDTSKPKPKRYDYDPHLDPQLIWSGKKEHTSFQDPAVSLHIHERIALEAIVLLFRRASAQPDLLAKPDADMS